MAAINWEIHHYMADGVTPLDIKNPPVTERSLEAWRDIIKILQKAKERKNG